MNNFFFLVIYLFSTSYALCQQSEFYTDKNYFYKNAENLYFDEVYKGGAHNFKNLLNFTSLNPIQKEFATFYTSMVSLLLNESFAIEKYAVFKQKYPESNLLSQANLPLGKYLLQQGKYNEAIKYLKNVSPTSLPKNKRDNYFFNLGYAYFMNQSYKEANINLEKISDNALYKNAINFMLGHINYSNEDYDTAFNYFQNLQEVIDYKNIIKPYLIQIYYNKKKYDKAIVEGENLLSTNLYPELKYKLSKIIGESYFQQKKYEEALPYLQTYIKNEPNPSQANYYQMGYIYYQLNQYNEAVQNFNKIINEKSAIAQNTFYQLGNSYLKTHQKKEALSAYKSASEMNYNTLLQEQAHYKYAKLSYEIGNPFESIAQALQSFIIKYPKADKKQEINTLLLKSYLKSKNYSGVLEALNQIKNKNYEEKKIEQEVSLLLGIQLYNEGKYDKAIVFFLTAYNNKSNMLFTAKALFWSAESSYRLENYTKAINNLILLEQLNVTIEESQEIPYSLGYNYLKIRAFKKAIQSFQQYLVHPKDENKFDAEIRLADAYYGAALYDKANELYTKISQSNNENSEEALFNKAMIVGFQDNIDNKITALEQFAKIYPKSKLVDDAYYELGNAYQLKEDYKNSTKYFEKVITDKKDIELTALSLLGRAQNYANLNENNKAINEYKYIAKQFINSDYAAQAVIAAKSVYLKENRVQEFETWAKSTGYNISSEELEELNFTVCQKLYLDKKYNDAIALLEKFLQEFPKSSREVTLQYYLGNSYFKIENYSKAEKVLKKLSSFPNQYQEDVLLQLSQIYLKQGNDNETKLALEALEEVTQNNNYLQFADLELMYIYSDAKSYKKALEKANKVLENNKNSSTVFEEAHTIIARGNYFTRNISESKKQFRALEKSKNLAVKAEALYYKALFLNMDKKYDNSNKIVFDLANNLSNQQYWGAKALVLMADNYFQLKDNYQATYTLQQVIENYTHFPDVIKDAKDKLSLIKKDK